MLDRFVSHSLIGMVGSFVVWSVYFAAVYSLQAVTCIRGLHGARIAGFDVVTAGLLAITAVTLMIVAYLGWRSMRLARLFLPDEGEAPGASRADFMALTSALLAGLAFIATLWVALPMLLLPPCA